VREQEEEGGARAVIAGEVERRDRQAGGCSGGVTRLVFQDDVPVDFPLADCAVLCLRGAGRWWLNGGGDVQSVDDSGDVTEDGEEDVDEEVGAAAALEEDAEGGEEDGEDDLADVAGGGVSFGGFGSLE
jgi:hypothetical protein